MKLKLYTLLGVAISSLALSCKTASKLYQQGNYDEAVELAAKKLQKDPDDPKLNDLIRNSYKLAVDDHQAGIRDHSASSNELRWEWMYNDYYSLQRLYDAIRKVPTVAAIIQPVDYSSYLTTYAEKAGQTRFERGQDYMQGNDRKSFRNAYHEFQAALRFKPGNREIEAKMDEAYEYAVVNVVVQPIDQYGYQYSSFNYSNGNFDDAILRNLQYNTGNEFVKFYSSWDAKSRNIRADEVIDLHFSNINIGSYHDSKSKREVSKEVVIKETVYRPDSVVKQYGKVYAQITSTVRTMNSQGLLQVNIRDGNGQWLWTDNFTGNHYWRTEFATYTGDIRALDENDKQLVNRREEYPPSEDEIIRCIMEEIDQNLLNRLKDHYRSY